MNSDRRLGFLGLLYRADKAFIGEDLDKNLGEMKLVVVATDATTNTAEGFKKRLLMSHIPTSTTFTKADLGRALGHDEINFIGLKDKKAIASYIAKGANN